MPLFPSLDCNRLNVEGRFPPRGASYDKSDSYSIIKLEGGGLNGGV